MGPQGDAPFILGLDIGANSVGWALLRAERDPDDPTGKRLKPVELVRSGVRIFEAGTEGDIESGKDESRAVKRREARLRRRLLSRRRMRLEHLFRLLQRAGLLPTDAQPNPDEAPFETRARILSALDRSLAERYGKSAELAHVLPYWLRAQALDRALEPYELGRALYHLAQRRGFLSNRKSLPKKDEEDGTVKKAIGELRAKMEAAGARTLGEYFAGLDPTEERIRSRWTARDMYLSEFEAIWKSQERFRSALLTDDLRKKIHRAIFRQRPLKSAKGLIGGCQFERDTRGEPLKRAPLALLACQRFRMLQKVNDLTIRPRFGEARELTAEERSQLIDALETEEGLTFKQIRKLLKLPKDATFSHEAGGEERLPGDRTASKLGAIFGPRWADMSAEDRDRAVEDVRSIQKDEALEKRGRRAWGLEGKAAEQFGKLSLEEDHLGLSLKAVNKLLPHLERGVRYATAVKEVYGDRPPPPVAGSLPRVDEALPQLRNPAVHRALTELRKVVNAVVREHGKPAVVRIELARDLKKNRKDRMRIAKRNRDNQKVRERAADFIRPGSSIFDHKRADIEKVRLADECGWTCPYTGRPISRDSLFGSEPQFDIEHIVPFSRCLDDSFLNKTLCYVEENRRVKRNKTPFEAYGGGDGYEAILERVRRFKGDAAEEKFRRFKLQSLDSFDDFSSRQLNDTKYVSRLAAEYVGLLFGADKMGNDAAGTKRVQLGRGQITAFLRNEWHLNQILSDGGEKSRDDHRHHAVDAVAIAMTDARTVKMLSDAAEHAWEERKRRFASSRIPMPWETFYDDVKRAIDEMNVSRRVSRKVNGALHEETIYSDGKRDEDGKPCVHVRKAVNQLSKNDLEAIVDPAVRERVRLRLQELGGGEPSKTFDAEGKNHPYLVARDGRRIPIHSVRIRRWIAPFQVGSGPRLRNVSNDSNHHVEIVEKRDKKGRVYWDAVVVSTHEAIRRLVEKRPVVQRDHGEGARLVCSLAGGEAFEIDWEGGRAMFVARTITLRQNGTIGVEFSSIRDARKKKDIKAAKAWYSKSIDKLREGKFRKLQIGPLGELRWAND